MRQVLLGEIPFLPLMNIGMVDVRDVAQAHYEALVRPEASGHRFQLVSTGCFMTEIGGFLKEKYSDSYPKIVDKQAPYCLLKMLSFCNAQMKSMVKYWGMKKSYQNEKTTMMLGINFISVKQSVQDMVPALIETGYVPD